MERRGDVQNKIKEKERVILKARGMLESTFAEGRTASSLPRFRARDVFDFSCTSLSCYFYLSAESRAACWRTLVALKSANLNRVLPK